MTRRPFETLRGSEGASASQGSDTKERASRDAVVELPPVRVAIYDSMLAPPQVVELVGESFEDLINIVSAKCYGFVQERGGSLPFTIMKEVAENLVHAYFKEVVVSILDSGSVVRFSDQGPGIPDKEKAFEPGFSTATRDMKKIIKGVGCGLPVIRESLVLMGGKVSIEDNIGGGTVVTLELKQESKPAPLAVAEAMSFALSERQKKVLFLVTELGAVGPSQIADELGASLSSAYRDLICLEKLKLIESCAQGKRRLTSEGIRYLDTILNSS